MRLHGLFLEQLIMSTLDIKQAYLIGLGQVVIQAKQIICDYMSDASVVFGGFFIGVAI